MGNLALLKALPGKGRTPLSKERTSKVSEQAPSNGVAKYRVVEHPRSSSKYLSMGVGEFLSSESEKEVKK